MWISDVGLKRLLACLVALPFNYAMAAPVAGLQPGAPVQGNLQEQPGREWRLAVKQGDFVQGQLRGEASLRLLDSAGKPLRLLVDGQGMTRDFMFVAQSSENLALRPEPSSAWCAAAYELQITRVVARAEQRAPVGKPASPALQALERHIQQGGRTDSFWAERSRQGTPLVEQVDAAAKTALVTFLWRGARHNVKLFGAPSGNHDELTRLAGSDVWYRSYTVPTSTRMSYQLTPDVPLLDERIPDRRRALLATAQRDPLNPLLFASNRADDAFQQESLLVLPDAAPQPFSLVDTGVAKGSVQRVPFDSQVLHNRRDIYLYRPAGWQPGSAERGLLVLFDAHAYLRQVPTATVLDNLIAQQRIPPTAALIIANPSADARATELPPNPEFARFLADELLPWAASQGLSASAERTVIAGSSYGGLASAYAALRYPQHFGNVLSLSGSFWWAPPAQEPQWLTRLARDGERLPVRFFMRAGLFEPGKAGQVGILESNRQLRDVLMAKGYAVDYGEFAGGHDYAQWGGELANGLGVLLGRTSAAAGVSHLEAITGE